MKLLNILENEFDYTDDVPSLGNTIQSMGGSSSTLSHSIEGPLPRDIDIVVRRARNAITKCTNHDMTIRAEYRPDYKDSNGEIDPSHSKTTERDVGDINDTQWMKAQPDSLQSYRNLATTTQDAVSNIKQSSSLPLLSRVDPPTQSHSTCSIETVLTDVNTDVLRTSNRGAAPKKHGMNRSGDPLMGNHGRLRPSGSSHPLLGRHIGNTFQRKHHS